MAKTEKGKLKYLSRVFGGFSVERKNYVLNLARSLQEIQNNKIDLSRAGEKERRPPK